PLPSWSQPSSPKPALWGGRRAASRSSFRQCSPVKLLAERGVFVVRALDEAAFRVVTEQAAAGMFQPPTGWPMHHCGTYRWSFLTLSSAFQGRGPLTVLLLNVLAPRWFSR